jgi:saccharopine dehydrogenase-like NADP-dependent oxidoreductase
MPDIPYLDHVMNILVLGAGRSSSALIEYLIEYCLQSGHRLTVADASLSAAETRVKGRAIAKAFELEDPSGIELIGQADVVVSLLPAFLHIQIARHCLALQKHLLTASYISEEMKALGDEVQKKGLVFLNECGLDPGIDHMSAMQLIDDVTSKGGQITSFESFTGGLIAPQTAPENPWRYKFTWNPRNVVLAGQGTAKFLQEGAHKYVPYHQLFTRTTEVEVPGYGKFEGYANRDSLKYRETYGLQDVQTMIRGTLRNHGYCKAWNVLVQLGCCDDSYLMEDVANLTHESFIESFFNPDTRKSLEQRLADRFSLSPIGDELNRLRWSGFFSSEKVGLTTGTPAQITEHILNKRWCLQPGDQDLVVMWHRLVYHNHGQVKTLQAYLTSVGDDEIHTAMAKTVGLPLAMATRLVVENKVKQRGVLLPIASEFYQPILKELAERGITLKEVEF